MPGRPITISALRGAHQAQVPPRLGVRIVVVAALLQVLMLLALLFFFPARAKAASAGAIRGEVAVATTGGFARFVFTLAEETEAEVRLTNGIVIVAFKRPVDVPVDRIISQAGEYVNAARADPDGTAVRLALNRKVTVNSMAAGEKFFVDLLPEGWVGLAPGLPQEVVDDLARRAGEAEKKARLQEQASRQRTLPPVRVRVGIQPTFTRYTFGLPALIAVSVDRSDDKMTMTFEAPLRFDLADVQAALPPMVASVDAQPRSDGASVQFDFIGKVDLRTFREDNNFIVDVQPARVRTESEPANDLASLAARISPKRPEATAPAQPARAAATAPPKPEQAKPAQAAPAQGAPAAKADTPAPVRKEIAATPAVEPPSAPAPVAEAKDTKP